MLLAAFVAQQIGIAPIFGAFIVGLIMPRHAGLTEDMSRRLEDFVVTVLLPLFFVVTGLKVQVGSLDRWQLWVVALILFAVAVVGKWVGAMLAARYSGFSWRDSSALGALMNTRGLTELIVLNIGLELGLISTGLFTMLVLMAIVTTFMAGPALRLLDPRGELSEPPEEAFRRSLAEHEAAPVAPERSILVAPQDDRNIDALLALGGAPRAHRSRRASSSSRGFFVPSLSRPASSARIASCARRPSSWSSNGSCCSSAACRRASPRSPRPMSAPTSSASPRSRRSTSSLLNGSRPLRGEGIPGGEVGHVLEHAPCDVAVLVDREGVPTIDAEHPVVVPFGGGEHDWAAVELGAWIAASQGAKLKLLGAAADGEDGSRDASRLLANTSLVLQQLAGITAEPVLVTPGSEVIDAARGAGLLVVGLSDRWRDEGLERASAGDRQERARSDAVRPPRRTARRARTARRHDAVQVVGGEHRRARCPAAE